MVRCFLSTAARTEHNYFAAPFARRALLFRAIQPARTASNKAPRRPQKAASNKFGLNRGGRDRPTDLWLRLDRECLLLGPEGFDPCIENLLDAPLKLPRIKASLDALQLDGDDDLGPSGAVRLAREPAGRLVDRQPFRSLLDVEFWPLDVPVIHHLPPCDDPRLQTAQRSDDLHVVAILAASLGFFHGLAVDD